MKTLIFLLCLFTTSAWANDPKPGHHHLLYYLKHANFKFSPFRGPNAKINYLPQLKPLEFAQ